MNIQTYTANLEKLKAQVASHPMCFDLIEYKHHFLVVYPNPVCGIDGVRVAIDKSKSQALEIMLSRLEEAWQLDNPVLYPEAV